MTEFPYDEELDLYDIDGDDSDDDDSPSAREKPDLETTLNALRANDTGSAIFYGLSDLTSDEIRAVRPVWAVLPSAYRRKLTREMVEVAETNFDLEYSAIGRLALRDVDPEVREAAIELLWEDMHLDLIRQFIGLMQTDEAVPVRAAAASALGRFILAGELGELSEQDILPAQEATLATLNDIREDVDVRRRALEAISNCTHDVVDGAISDSYVHSDRRMRVSAVYAMGRACDPKWGDIVLHEISSADPEMRYEATRAAGELELRNAVPQLAQVARDGDREIREMAIWSLGEIGGADVMRLLQKFARDAEQDDDDELLEAIQDAIASANLGGDSMFIL